MTGGTAVAVHGFFALMRNGFCRGCGCGKPGGESKKIGVRGGGSGDHLAEDGSATGALSEETENGGVGVHKVPFINFCLLDGPRVNPLR